MILIKRIKQAILLCLITLFVPINAEHFDLFILAGQSNMQGWRSNAAQYPTDYHNLDEKIPFYYKTQKYGSSNGEWWSLGPQPGHFQSGHFGPEISFARVLSRYNYQPAIFKYSSGGTSIKKDWKAPGAKGLYDDMVMHLKKAINELTNNGHTVSLAAFVWIQGESDAYSAQLANEYYWHLRKMITHMRNNVLKSPDLPLILSVDELHPRVQTHPQVVQAQRKLANELRHSVFMSMKGLEKDDVTHLTAKGTIHQGMRLFQSYKTALKP